MPPSPFQRAKLSDLQNAIGKDIFTRHTNHDQNNLDSYEPHTLIRLEMVDHNNGVELTLQEQDSDELINAPFVHHKADGRIEQIQEDPQGEVSKVFLYIKKPVTGGRRKTRRRGSRASRASRTRRARRSTRRH